MSTLEEQYKTINESNPHVVLLKCLEALGIDERGGGPEGLYYTHPLVNGEYLYRFLHLLVDQVLIARIIKANKRR
jgi:hypothetical protein